MENKTKLVLKGSLLAGSIISLGALQANLSENYPQLSGIILTGGLIPENSILKLIEGFDHHI